MTEGALRRTEGALRRIGGALRWTEAALRRPEERRAPQRMWFRRLRTPPSRYYP
jgi:hypothetical protein